MIKDEEILNSLSDLLVNVNDKVKEISYVSSATKELNDELKKLSYNNEKISVMLDSGAIGIDQFIEKLELSSNTNGKKSNAWWRWIQQSNITCIMES
ncbi:hypothetical protein LNP74_02410 [Klebsiella pneumoniae subsp. pneumoniae]|nr:hypothetical protein [Klebsiella pneumoniae subsp. pneumoniae]